MPTPNKDNVEKMMREFQKHLSEKDKEFMVSMAQDPQPEPPKKSGGKSSKGVVK